MYKVSRIGLLNFWLYDEEEYEFFDGKLLLRGKNGSGKSVTMQSFIPLILDGNKTPKRLDTFGGSDKHIEYYLLGEDKDASTGYLYMEFFNKEEEKYITIGIGLNARRGKPTEFYGFLLKDGTRIHHGFELYKLKDGFSKTPLTKLELKTRLLPNNLFTETAKEYKKMVNDYLFGFKSIDSYDEFINIILQIRSPKLSKDYKPSLLMKTLNEVLPPLADEDLMPLSETIESLNSTKEQIEDLNNKIKELSNFIKVYQNYNESILIGKIKKYLDQKDEFEKVKKEEAAEEKSILTLEKEQEKITSELNELKIEYEKANVEKANMENTDIEEKSRKVVRLEQEIKWLEEKINKNNQEVSTLNDKIRTLREKEQEITEKIEEIKRKLTEELGSAETLIEDIHFDMLKKYISLLMKGEKVEETSILDLIREKKKSIERTKKLLEEKDEYNLKIEEESQKENKIEKEYQELGKEIDKLESQIEEEKQTFIDTFMKKNQEHTEIYLEEMDIKELIFPLQEFNLKTIEQAKKKYEEIYQMFWQKKKAEEVELINKLNTFKENKKEEEQILEELKNKKEAELSNNDLEWNAEEFLIENKIKFIPFYKAIDFNKNLSEKVKNALEANLLSSGLLNAKIIKKEDKEKLKDTNISYLIPSDKKKENLTKYLQVAEECTFDKGYVTSLLESISIESKDAVYLNEESYAFEFLKGNNKNYESKYIGYLNRQKEHRKKIEEQEHIVNESISKITTTENLIQTVRKKLNTLEEEKQDFPSTNNIKDILSNIEHINLKVEVNREEKRRIEEKLSTLNQSLKNLLITLGELKKENNIPLNLGAFNEAYASILTLESTMSTVYSYIARKENYEDLKIGNQSHLEDVSITYDNLLLEINSEKEETKKKEIEKNAINEILNTKEYQEIATKLKKIEEILESYPSKKEHLDQEIGRLKSEIESKKTNVKKLAEKVKTSDLYAELYYNILESEFKLGYVEKDFELTKENGRNLLEKLGNKEGRDKVTATANYYKGFNTYRNILMDYTPTDVLLFETFDSNLEYYEEKELPKQEIIEILKEATRQDITVTYQNKKMNLYSLLSSLKDDYETNKIYLSEKDRHLFEDILLRTVGSKIKEKINNAKEWVKSINTMMEEKQTDSNLRFYLSWLNKSKESLEEMDTKELVEIFKIDPDMLRKEDIDRLIKHFRAKIARAEETMGDNKESYFDIIFKILDYRNWFEFKLFYKRGIGDKKELTDKTFSVFSGGEKAKTMYVPLFASASAKLASAKNNAPRLIALDEAFAGVDDLNIEEMFAILKSFNLDYILTSQALWCDYKEIKDISICELIGDPLTNTIGVKRYRWNGNTKISLDEINELY